MTEIRIAVIDDHPLFREGVMRSLAEFEGFEIVGEGSTRDDAVRISEEQDPDVLLLDISMPGGGLDAIPVIRDRFPDQKIVILTVSEDIDDVREALHLGAQGYVLKGVGSRALADAVQTITSGESYVSPALSAKLLNGAADKPDPFAELTAREQEVLELVSSGLSNKLVARQLDLHEKTVKHHMTRIFAKLKVTNRTEAAIAARTAREFRRY